MIGVNVDHERHILFGRGTHDDGQGLIEHGPGFSNGMAAGTMLVSFETARDRRPFDHRDMKIL
jgi:hypothetical protein